MPVMAKPGKAIRAVFKGIGRMNRSLSIDVGPVHATGVPAILIGVTGIVVASGIASALVRGAARLPETLAQARALAEAIRSDQPRLNA
jgi:hypothetical protein